MEQRVSNKKRRLGQGGQEATTSEDGHQDGTKRRSKKLKFSLIQQTGESH